MFFIFVKYIKNECRAFKQYESDDMFIAIAMLLRCLVLLPLLEAFKSLDIWKRNNDYMLMRFITNVCLMRTCDTLANDPNQGPVSIFWRDAGMPIPLYIVPTPWPSAGQCHVSRGQAPGPACIITISGDVTQSRPRPRLPIMCPACPAGYIGECVGNAESRWRNKQRIDRQ